MRRSGIRRMFAVAALGLSAGGIAGPHRAPAEEPTEKPPAMMKVGLTEADITPSIGMECPGGYGKAFHRKVQDPCKVRAAVFDDGASRVAVVSVDALMVPRALVEAARAEIGRRCGIAPEAILIGASHSHSSGPTGMVQPGEFDIDGPLVRRLAYEKSSCADPEYLRTVERAVVDAVCQADAGRVEARCGVGAGREDQVAFNRRFRMRDGRTLTHPGKGNPDIVEPAGPIDPCVGVIGVWDASGTLLGCVVNYACHATTPAEGISANWIYWLERTVRGVFGPQAVVVFLQGASGDVTQVNNRSTARDPDAALVGGRVGAEAVKVLLSMPRGRLAPLAARTTTLEIERRRPRPERVEECLELVQRPPEEVGHTRWVFAKEIVLLDAIVARGPRQRVEVQAIQIGPAVLLANPAEFFCQLGLEIRRESPFALTMPVELANGCVGYVPTEEAFGPHGGGYETRLTAYSNLEPTAGRRIVEASLELARQLAPGQPPTEPSSTGWSKPWEYGNVPPELD